MKAHPNTLSRNHDRGTRSLLLACTLFSLPLASLSAQSEFAPPEVHWTRHAASAFDTVDVDGDSLPDLLMGANERIAWSRNQGDGTLGAPNILSTAQSVASIHGADMDGDGDTDLVLGHRGAITIRENIGNQTFRNTGTLANGSYFNDLSLADLDGDMDLDILGFWQDAGGGAANSQVIRIENLGFLTFAPAQVVHDPMGPGSGAVLAADFDGDGDPDVVHSTRDGVALATNLGLGVLAAPIFLSTVASVADLLAADLNGDGRDDLITTENGLTWYANQSAPGLPGFGSGQVLMTQTSCIHVAAADFDQDGDTDLATNGQDQVVVYWNLGTGTFGSGTRLSTLARNSREVHARDLTGNGYPDLFYAGWSSQEFVFRRNMGQAFAATGQGIPGTSGIPVLYGLGDLRTGTPVTLGVSGALPSTPAVFILGTSRIDFPLLGGVLVPLPEAQIATMTNALGQALLNATWPRGPAGIRSYVQVWLLDAGAGSGLASTNGLQATSQ